MASIDLLQWPAMVVTVMAAWLVASQRKFKRNWGFWLFLNSNTFLGHYEKRKRLEPRL